MLYAILGVLVGGRLGFVISSDFRYYLANPIKNYFSLCIFPEGLQYTGILGMAYHGWANCCITDLYLFFVIKKKIIGISPTFLFLLFP